MITLTLIPAEADFFPTLGMLITNKQIAAELGEPMYVNAAQYWVVAKNKIEVMAFGCLDTEKRKALMTYGYVLPEYRGLGLHRYLFAQRLELAHTLGVPSVVGIANAASDACFRQFGFIETSKRGKYTRYEKAVI